MNTPLSCLFVVFLGLVGCTAAQQQRAVADGQLYCATATADGPLIVALSNSLGVPVLATNVAASVVAANCAALGGIPVSPPLNASQAPVVSVKLPGES